LNNLEKASYYLTKRIQVCERLLEEAPTELAYAKRLLVAYGGFALFCMNHEQWEEAIQYAEKERELAETLYPQHPEEIRKDLHLVYMRLGVLYQELNQLSTAYTYLQKDAAILEILYQASPFQMKVKETLAALYLQLGALSIEREKLEEAAEYFMKGEGMYAELIETDPANEEFVEGHKTAKEALELLIPLL